LGLKGHADHKVGRVCEATKARSVPQDLKAWLDHAVHSVSLVPKDLLVSKVLKVLKALKVGLVSWACAGSQVMWVQTVHWVPWVLMVHKDMMAIKDPMESQASSVETAIGELMVSLVWMAIWEIKVLMAIKVSLVLMGLQVHKVGQGGQVQLSRRPDLEGCEAHGDELTYVSLGEGACSEGEFWESLNTACTLHLPVLFVVVGSDIKVRVAIKAHKEGKVLWVGKVQLVGWAQQAPLLGLKVLKVLWAGRVLLRVLQVLKVQQAQQEPIRDHKAYKDLWDLLKRCLVCKALQALKESQE